MAAYEELEAAFSAYIGVGHTVTTNTGTAALHLAIEGRHYPPGSEIIVPEFSMVATSYAVWYARCTPVFVDCRDDMNIDSKLIEAKISRRTRAILITHVYGRICDMAPIVDLCQRHGLDLIEDCCEVHGARYHDGPAAGRRVGSLGIGCFSFYRNKIVHAEEGGAVCIAGDAAYAAELRDLKNMAFGAAHDYVHEKIGFNYRMPDSQARLALASLARIEDSLASRRQVAAWYDAVLATGFVRPPRDVVWIYDINCDDPTSLVRALNEQGFPARRSFAPMSMQPCFGVRPGHQQLRAWHLYQHTCYLPVTDTMTRQEVERIGGLVNQLGRA